MKKVLVGLLVSASLIASPAFAGCLAGAAVGGVGGHFVGKGHALLGAAGGCAAGHYISKNNDRKRQEEMNRNQQNRQNNQQRN